MSENKGKIKNVEDKTKYGEVISSLFNWITLDKQKEKAKQMDEMTKNK